MKTLADIPLADNERAAIEEASRRLKRELPVSRVILFGSKARGTARADSDTDLLVLTSREVTRETRRAIGDILHEIGLRDDLLLLSLVQSEKEWNEGLIRYMLIHSEVERDGVEL